MCAIFERACHLAKHDKIEKDSKNRTYKWRLENMFLDESVNECVYECVYVCVCLSIKILVDAVDKGAMT